ncbi:MAG: hypothetical protein L0287_10130 [Anaerolineae bacterium]|nr:hypothetical protein [Anaerolineae bacterium]
MRLIHLMANRELDISALQKYGPPAGGLVINTKFQTGTWHLWATWPYRGRLDIAACISSEKKFRRLVVWSIDGYGSARDAIRDASNYFWRAFRFEPGYCFFRRLPAGVEFGQDFPSPQPRLQGASQSPNGRGRMILLAAEWMLERCVAVGGRR